MRTVWPPTDEVEADDEDAAAALILGVATAAAEVA
jgi:hypothetical protein